MVGEGLSTHDLAHGDWIVTYLRCVSYRRVLCASTGRELSEFGPTSVVTRLLGSLFIVRPVRARYP